MKLPGRLRGALGLGLPVLIVGIVALVAYVAVRPSSLNRAQRLETLSSASDKDAHTSAAVVAEQIKKGKHPNRLIHEKSPYLLQHAFNPVDWFPWGDDAFQRARKENKLIFLSIGYSTCYWCHVMEREVFENEELAALMNKDFVSIKVDREERPDVDRVYMAALQAMTGGGGWPMSLFLTPDLKPFFGATYIPPRDFGNILTRIQETWMSTPEKLRQSGEKLGEVLRKQMTAASSRSDLDRAVLTKGYQQFEQQYDGRYGGFGGAPKFPRPVVFNFLLHYYSSFGERKASEMTLETLRKIAQGGIYDHLGGGFHRYSVDAQWHVPHFEKMIYDQAQLASSYLDAYQITHDASFASVARETLGYVLRNMTSSEGGFYSAEDAESAPDASKPQQKEEGAFYTWSTEEIDRILGKDRGRIFDYVYGVDSKSVASEDRRGVAAGRNVLHFAHSAEEAATKFGKPVEEIKKSLSESRAKLFQEREKRSRPNLDDKVLVSWNGLMISAFARAYQVLDDPNYLNAAQKSAGFILTKLYSPKTRRLLRRYRAGEARYDAHLEDCAFLTEGLVDLYEASQEVRWLKAAIDLTATQNALFYDQKSGGFFDTSGSDANLFLRTREDYDGAEPAGSSVATLNLLRLAQMTNNQHWKTMAEQTLAVYGERLKQFPEAMPQMLVALDFKLSTPKEIIIAGKPQSADTRRMLFDVRRRFLPNKILMLADGGSGQEFLSQYLPFINSVHMRDNKATAYVCENYACKLPTTDLAVMAKLLETKPAERP